MDLGKLERWISRPAAKPYRSKRLIQRQTTAGGTAVDPELLRPALDDDGHVAFDDDDIENPKNWSPARRWYITMASVLLVVNATFASSSPSGCLGSIIEDFGVSQEVGSLVITVYLLGYVFGPLLWGPLSEFYGRRPLFLLTFTLYLCFTFLCAFTPNYAGLLIGRFLTGTFASASLSNSPGVLVDIWGPMERGNAMAVFSMMTFVGPALGPLTSGFIQLKLNWRWSFYVLLWLAGITQLMLLTIPETLGPIVLLNKARRIRKQKIPGYEDVQAPVESEDRSLANIFKTALTRPWLILVDPISFAVAVYLSVVYALLYMLFSIYPIVFQKQRGWNAGVGQLPLLGVAIGAVLGGGLVFWQTQREVKAMRAGHKPVAEDRLSIARWGGILFAASMFGFGWSANFNYVHWIVPTIFGVFLAASILIIFTSMLNYLTDSYLRFAASALAANTVARSLAGAAAPLFTRQMFTNLGVGPGASIVGGIACLLAPIPFIFIKYGGPIRERSKFAPTPTGPKPVNKEEEDTDSSPSQDAPTPPASGDLSLQRSKSAISQSGSTTPLPRQQKKYWQDESNTIAQQIRDMQAGVPYVNEDLTMTRTRTGGSASLGLRKTRTGEMPKPPTSPGAAGIARPRVVKIVDDVPERVQEEGATLSTEPTHLSEGSEKTAVDANKGTQ
ncbi:major facilitator superfamily domain-containing protein [Protomyces lactucae-debilis]|uniref:Major facilitator superfamily domain-containing protein n=1 Tax=Protomyces lactucae-debilis TaxID=2754530 RepID=A0A1Y2F522_PROLT|nr:major facilitator superfamily domain-containing protein [Protomyces lactucae-debilis]ORY78951.1 major facilitator superfamily domain-containing protein [Protomyces lactucae-debilis]